MKRHYTEWADRLYAEHGKVAHIVPWDISKRALCQVPIDPDQWRGTGDWHETETAAWMPLCKVCEERA